MAENGALLEEIKKIDKTKAYQRTIKTINTPARKIMLNILKVASIVFLLIGSWYLFSVNEIPQKKQLIAKNGSSIIKNTAQLITDEETYELDKLANNKIEGKNFKLLKDKNNRLKYEKQIDTNIYHTVKTASCNQYNITLSDGSVIYINSNSKVKYPVRFSSQKREIFVEGEVYCEIAKSTVPFIVHTSNKEDITVLGTKFNVRNYSSEKYTEVTLAEGKVKVSDNQNECILKPDQQVVINNGFKLKAVESSYFTSWTKPVIRFHNMRLARVINSLEQLYGVHFEIETERLKEKLIAGGIIKNKALEKNLEILKESCNLTITHKNNKYVIKESLSN
jgi:preprotein translocase subunit Sss1